MYAGGFGAIQTETRMCFTSKQHGRDFGITSHQFSLFE